jgi:hypothetical protein
MLPCARVVAGMHTIWAKFYVMEGAKASAPSPVMDEPEAPTEPQPRRRSARARLFVLLEAGVQPDDAKVFDRGRHTHTHRLAS